MVVVRSGAGFFLKRMLEAVLRDNRVVSPHQHVSWVVLIRTFRVIGFISLFLVFI
jgi:hypothetical protein